MLTGDSYAASVALLQDSSVIPHWRVEVCPLSEVVHSGHAAPKAPSPVFDAAARLLTWYTVKKAGRHSSTVEGL